MVILQAPYPLILVTSFLPDPEFKDEVSANVKLNLKRALNGTPYTYVKTTSKSKLEWDFDVSIWKALEINEFYQNFTTQKIKITDWNSLIYVGYFIIDEVDLTPRMIKEYCKIHLVFEVEQIV
jgi:hypothetical protein